MKITFGTAVGYKGRRVKITKTVLDPNTTRNRVYYIEEMLVTEVVQLEDVVQLKGTDVKLLFGEPKSATVNLTEGTTVEVLS